MFFFFSVAVFQHTTYNARTYEEVDRALHTCPYAARFVVIPLVMVSFRLIAPRNLGSFVRIVRSTCLFIWAALVCVPVTSTNVYSSCRLG